MIPQMFDVILLMVWEILTISYWELNHLGFKHIKKKIRILKEGIFFWILTHQGMFTEQPKAAIYGFLEEPLWVMFQSFDSRLCFGGRDKMKAAFIILTGTIHFSSCRWQILGFLSFQAQRILWSKHRF